VTLTDASNLCGSSSFSYCSIYQSHPLVKFKYCPTTGIGEDKRELNGIEVYPNPLQYNTTTIKFRNPERIGYTFRLYSIDGRVCLTVNDITADKVEIDRADLVSGIYFIELSAHEGARMVRKLVVY
jgi:hypothetical protein